MEIQIGQLDDPLTITIMRYKIEYSRTKTDRWGHFITSPFQTEFANNLEEAEDRARILSTKLKKHDVTVFDTEGPQFRDVTAWCVYGFKGGRRIFVNEDYFKAIYDPAIMESWY